MPRKNFSAGVMPFDAWAVVVDGRVAGGHSFVAVFWTRSGAREFIAKYTTLTGYRIVPVTIQDGR